MFQILASAILILLVCPGCRTRPEITPPSVPEPSHLSGYSIQVGAFVEVSNAIRLTRRLNSRGLDAYYFRHESGLFKVRFGDFPARKEAAVQAAFLQKRHLIEDFYIVGPESYSVTWKAILGRTYLEDRIVASAENYLGLPYSWGGTSPSEGFDCSGLTMAVYRLNGLNLPRSSQEQFNRGIPVKKNNLQKGDLVFFATSGKGRVSHVGIYTGGGVFIHAPGKNKTIRKDSLSLPYYSRRFMGARRYTDFQQ